MKDKIVIFGAGAIGRGLLGDIAVTNGFATVFIEAVPNLAKELAKSDGYHVHLAGKVTDEHFIASYKVLSTDNKEAISVEIAECIFIATAVGGANLVAIAGLIASGLGKRQNVLNILVCENWPEADRILADALVSKGCAQKSFACVPCSVERMAKSSKKSLDVVVESEQSLYVNGTIWTGPRPEIDELLFCDNIEAYYKRKLYTNNAGHVLLAYMGYLAGCELLYEALEIPEIRKNLMDLLDVASQALSKSYGIEAADMQRHIDELVRWRFSNHRLADTVKRVARDPLRKLGPQERLVGLANLLKKHDLPTRTVSGVIAAAMQYRDNKDHGSAKLDEIVTQQGPGYLLQKICDFNENDRCYQECLEAYESYLSTDRTRWKYADINRENIV